MSEYLLLIFGDESAQPATAEAFDEMMAAHSAFGEAVAAAGGQITGGNALQPAGTATTVRGDGSGGHLITDGAFIESKEALAGYYLIEAADFDQALAFAKLCPAPGGGVELRPVLHVG